MKIKETNCKLCVDKKTTYGFFYFDKLIPVCIDCIKFIRKLKEEDFKQEDGE